MPVTRKEFVLALLAGAAGACLVVLAARQAWAHAIFTPPRPLPTQDISVTGQQLVPLASALALAALACLAAVIATRSVLRRAVGVLLAILGAGAAAAGAVLIRFALLGGALFVPAAASAWRPRERIQSQTSSAPSRLSVNVSSAYSARAICG